MIGRILFGGFSLYNGLHHLRHKQETVPYAASKGVPRPELAVTLSSISLIVGGTSLELGITSKIGSAALLGSLAGVSSIMHDFWRNEDPSERQTNLINFMRTLRSPAAR